MAKPVTPAPHLLRALAPFTTQLRSTPHRDATHVPYGQWFRLYVEAIRSLSEAHRTHPQTAGRAESLDTLAWVKSAVDTALWSSVCAGHWTQVVLPDSASASPTVWYVAQSQQREDAAALLDNNVVYASPILSRFGGAEGRGEDQNSRGEQRRILSIGSSMEIVSPGYLTEPLSGGAALTDWMTELRSLATTATDTVSGGTESSSAGRNTADDWNQGPTFHICVPFSVLYQLKYEAHLRGTGTAAAATATAEASTPLSLQERRARHTLLQSLHQVLQVQEDMRTANGGRPLAPHLQLHAWAPSVEFDMLCDLPRLRPLLSRGGKHKGGEDPLALVVVCEALSARLVYFTRHIALASAASAQKQRAKASRGAGERQAESECGTRDSALSGQGPERQPLPVSLLAHSGELRMMRALGAPRVRDRSAFSTWKQQLAHVAGEDVSSVPGGAVRGGILGGRRRSSSSRAHQQAWRGCNDAIRRMTAREENIRQSFSQH